MGCGVPRTRPLRASREQAATATATGDQAAAAAYVAALLADLAGIARRHKLDTLGNLLEMVRLEAEVTVQNSTTKL
jgi:hypothetical protein